MSTAHTLNPTNIMPDPAVGANGNGYQPERSLAAWGYPYGVESLPELLRVLEDMSDSIESLRSDAEELLDKATAALAFAEERIRINLARERRRARRRERRK